MLITMANIISPKVNNKISHLMKLRREVLNDEGPNSKNFLKIDKNFKNLLTKYDLVHTELNIGFMNKK